MSSPRTDRGSIYANDSYIDQFKEKARDWAKQVVELHNMDVGTVLQPKKKSLLSTASTIKKTIESVFGTFDELENVGLGVAFLIPVAVIAAALAAIAKWTYDYQKLKVLLSEQQRLESAGLSPQTAANVIAKKIDSSLINIDTKKMIPLVGAIALLFWLKGKGRI